MVAATIGSHWVDMRPKHRMIPTPAGTKKNPRLRVRKSAKVSTCDNLIMPHSSEVASKTIPIMLLGTGTPVSQTTSSPMARKQKRTAHCKIKFMTAKIIICDYSAIILIGDILSGFLYLCHSRI